MDFAASGVHSMHQISWYNNNAMHPVAVAATADNCGGWQGLKRGGS